MTSDDAQVAAAIDDAIDDDWQGQARWWDWGTYGGLALFVVTILVAGVTGYPLWVSAAGAAAIAASWRLVGARAVATDDPRLGYRHLAVAYACTIAVTTVTGLGPLILLVVFTHTWMILTRIRAGITAVAGVSAACVLARWWYFDFDGTVLANLLPQMVMITVFSVGMGVFTHKVISQAESLAALARNLRATRAELAASQHEAGVYTERERVSREIHDTLAQGFMSVVTLSQVAQRSLAKGDVDAARERLALMESTARENLAEARTLVAAYAPVSLQDASLTDALERLVTRWAADTGIEVAVSVDPALPALASSSEVGLLRAAQEALTNVRRHARAHAVSVALRWSDAAGVVALTVADDGVGMPPGTLEGYGLTGMRDRVSAVGGTVLVMSTVEGRGTAVTVSIPASPGALGAGKGTA